ncbi:hypothetical protein QJS10_CPA08g00729 [Acorus calamus]|uniref:Uncharacterized protein n=1 Tax=Acorus calamus TaxID=4465 RepID=A0AAV9EBL3_ACOCL|nr:hypothetical protein QJS10_CPA08g00729 [Acorus calamus]
MGRTFSKTSTQPCQLENGLSSQGGGWIGFAVNWGLVEGSAWFPFLGDGHGISFALDRLSVKEILVKKNPFGQSSPLFQALGFGLGSWLPDKGYNHRANHNSKCTVERIPWPIRSSIDSNRGHGPNQIGGILVGITSGLKLLKLSVAVGGVDTLIWPHSISGSISSTMAWKFIRTSGVKSK